MTGQTEVALQNVRYVSNLGSHTKVFWDSYEKIGFVPFKKSDMGSICVKSQNWATFACSVNIAYGWSTLLVLFMLHFQQRHKSYHTLTIMYAHPKRWMRYQGTCQEMTITILE